MIPLILPFSIFLMYRRTGVPRVPPAFGAILHTLQQLSPKSFGNIKYFRYLCTIDNLKQFYLW